MTKEQNLKPVRTKSEARDRGRAGGIKSGISRRNKKLMSQMYGEMLSGRSGITIQAAVIDLLHDKRATAQGARFALLKEIREATEPPPRKKFDINRYMAGNK